MVFLLCFSWLSLFHSQYMTFLHVFGIGLPANRPYIIQDIIISLNHAIKSNKYHNADSRIHTLTVLWKMENIPVKYVESMQQCNKRKAADLTTHSANVCSKVACEQRGIATNCPFGWY